LPAPLPGWQAGGLRLRNYQGAVAYASGSERKSSGTRIADYFASGQRAKSPTIPNDSAKERQTDMRPPSKRGTAVIPVDQQRNNSIFKVSLRSWQQQYKARQSGRTATEEEKLVAPGARN
jgi:hypothetical protein